MTVTVKGSMIPPGCLPASLEQFAIPFFGDMLMKEVEPRDIRLFIKHLKDYRTAQGQPLSIASVVKNLTPVKSAFATAAEDGTLDTDPAISVRVKRPQKVSDDEDIRIPTKDEFSRLLTATPDRYKLMVKLCGSTGLRSSELIALDWSHLDLTGEFPVIQVRQAVDKVTGEVKPTKSRAGVRDVTITHALAAELIEHRGSHVDGPMFRTKNGTRYQYRNLLRMLNTAANNAGLDWEPGWHSIRHYYASHLIAAGRNVAM